MIKFFLASKSIGFNHTVECKVFAVNFLQLSGMFFSGHYKVCCVGISLVLFRVYLSRHLSNIMIWQRIVRASDWDGISCTSLLSQLWCSRCVRVQGIKRMDPPLLPSALLLSKLVTINHLASCYHSFLFSLFLQFLYFYNSFIAFHLFFLQTVFAFCWRSCSRIEVGSACGHRCWCLQDLGTRPAGTALPVKVVRSGASGWTVADYMWNKEINSTFEWSTRWSPMVVTISCKIGVVRNVTRTSESEFAAGFQCNSVVLGPSTQLVSWRSHWSVTETRETTCFSWLPCFIGLKGWRVERLGSLLSWIGPTTNMTWFVTWIPGLASWISRCGISVDSLVTCWTVTAQKWFPFLIGIDACVMLLYWTFMALTNPSALSECQRLLCLRAAMSCLSIAPRSRRRWSAVSPRTKYSCYRLMPFFGLSTLALCKGCSLAS